MSVLILLDPSGAFPGFDTGSGVATLSIGSSSNMSEFDRPPHIGYFEESLTGTYSLRYELQALPSKDGTIETKLKQDFLADSGDISPYLNMLVLFNSTIASYGPV